MASNELIKAAEAAGMYAFGHPATEAQADRAIVILKRAINAAENSNQAGEDAVVRAAAAITISDEELADLFADAMSNVHDMDTGINEFARACVKALRGATADGGRV